MDEPLKLQLGGNDNKQFRFFDMVYTVINLRIQFKIYIDQITPLKMFSKYMRYQWFAIING